MVGQRIRELNQVERPSPVLIYNALYNFVLIFTSHLHSEAMVESVTNNWVKRVFQDLKCRAWLHFLFLAATRKNTEINCSGEGFVLLVKGLAEKG